MINVKGRKQENSLQNGKIYIDLLAITSHRSPPMLPNGTQIDKCLPKSSMVKSDMNRTFCLGDTCLHARAHKSH